MELLSVHPAKKKAKGLPVFTVPLTLYSDDTSGNRSKKWNKFDVWVPLLAGLPRTENARMKNLHLMSASNQVCAKDVAEAIVTDLHKLEEEGVQVYDASLGQIVLIFAPVLCLICDNGRSTELLNLAGSSALKYCRMCLVSEQ